MLLAHSFGERYDLPIPLVLFVVGGGLVVLLSFLLVFNRRVPAAPVDDVRDGAEAAAPRAFWGVLGLLSTAALVYAGLAGTQELAENIVPTVFWLLVWIAVPLTCGLLGDWTRPVNPFAFLARTAGGPRLRRTLLARTTPLPWPRVLGWWPAAVLFFLLACGELIVNLTAALPHVIATGLLVYALVSAAAGLLLGPAWVERGEVFSVLFSTWGRLGWFRFGAPGAQGFTGGLRAGFEDSWSRIAFVLLLLVSVSFDGLLATPRWSTFEQVHVSGELHAFRFGSFLALAVLTGAVFGAFALASARAGGRRVGVAPALAALLPSMVPIAYAYLLAHNLKYLLVNGQLLGPLIGDPTGRHDLGLPYPFNDTLDPNPNFLPGALFWYVSLVAIVGAHVLAVVLAHGALARSAADERLARRSEYPWLVAMVAYTMVSLTLIAQQQVEDAPTGGGASGDVRAPGLPGPPAAGALQHRLDVTVDAAGAHRHGA